MRGTQGDRHAQPAALPAEVSAQLRDQLLRELTNLDEVSALTAWAHKTLPRKNELTNPDAMTLEEAFTERLTKLAAAPSGDELPDAQGQARPIERNGHEQATGPAAKEVMVLSPEVLHFRVWAGGRPMPFGSRRELDIYFRGRFFRRTPGPPVLVDELDPMGFILQTHHKLQHDRL
jgi:hypothetical protein